MPVRVAFATLGCKVNRADTALIREGLPTGVELVAFGQPADVYVINTCTVTATADRQSRQLVHRAHRANPDAAVIVTGCLADQRPEEVQTLDGVVYVAGNAAKPMLAAEVARRFGLTAAVGEPLPRYHPEEVTRPPLKIQDGCDGVCAYCAVAAARGRRASLDADRVLARLAALGRQGCAEVVLAGIDLGAWGRDLDPPGRLATLLERVRRKRPVQRVRLSSIEIRHLDDDVLRVMASTSLICRHLHLPLQSGADPVLGRMRRSYDVSRYTERVRAAQAGPEGVVIGADVIAGFPGERDVDHRRTLGLLEELGVGYLHVFPFSPRPGTPAAGMSDQVPGPVVRRRARELRRLGEQLWRDCRRALQGRETTAVISTKRRGDRLTGFSDQAVPLVLDGDGLLQGRLVRVVLGELNEDGMEATVVDRLVDEHVLQ
jgi:threonylcarbamoyladenosine tRNA methylthiotransferase MtaB